MARKKKHVQHEEEHGEDWLLPYSDLMTLLLAVFIVLFASSQVDKKAAENMSEEFTKQMMTSSYAELKFNLDPNATEKTEEESLEELKFAIDKKLLEENMSYSASTYIDQRGLVISLNNAIYFESGSAEIKKEYQKTLKAIANILNAFGSYIRIEGHTDNRPISSAAYPSNWELSSARATSVVRLFLSEPGASPDKFFAVGYGEYRPVADNSTLAGRSKNRRIDIIVLSEEYSELEKQVITQ